MKKIIIILTLSFYITGITFAQVPNAFRYQAVVRDASGNFVANKITGLRISILGGSANGQAIFSETFNQYVTNDFGMVALNIGSGTAVLGNFSQIDWGANTYYLQVEIDINGGVNYQFMGTSQILSVPYAIHALTVTNKDDADADPNNEIQTISKNGNLITLSDGGLSVTTDDADADITNEIQDLFLDVNTNILRITNNPDATPISLSAYQGANTDQQILSYTTNINDELELTIGGGTGGNTISIPFDFVSAQGGGTFLGNIYAPNLTTANMDNNDIVDAYQAGWAYYMTQDDKTELGFLSLTNNFSVSGGAVSLNAAEGSSILNLPASGYLATRTWVNNNTLINSLLYGHILVGNSSGSAIPVDASGNAEILIGNGNTIRSRGIFGDISLLNTGAVTVNSIGGQNISLGSSFTTTTDDIILNANVAGSNVTLPISGVLANQDYVDDEIATNNNLTTGNILVGNGGVATALPVFTNGRILIGDGTTINSRPIGGDATLASNGILTLENTTVTAGTYAGIAVNSKGLITGGTALTTLGAYGILDAMSTSHDASVITTINITNWNNAFGWGDHSAAGYLTSFSELDPIFAAWNRSTGISITTSQISNFTTSVTNNAAVLLNTAKSSYPTADASKLSGIAIGAEVNVNADWNATNGDAQIMNKPTTINGYNISDAMSTSHDANVITATNINNWNTAYGWGDHSTAGYLSSFSELDPVFTNWNRTTGISITSSQVTDFITSVTNNAAVLLNTAKNTYPSGDATKLAGIETDADITDATNVTAAGAIMDGDFSANGLMVRTAAETYSIIPDNSANWNTAFGWGNHASVGYITASSTTTFTEKSGNISMWTNDEGYLTAITEEADESTAGVGQTSFTLSSAPSANSIVKMYVNGLRVSNSDYSVTGVTLTYSGTALTGTERVQFDYYY